MTYISRADVLAAIEAAKSPGDTTYDICHNAALDEALAAINALPAVTVTDDMVSNAVRAYVAYGKKGGKFMHEAMRLALEAALPDAPI